LGFIVGAILFGLTYNMVFPVVSGITNLGMTYMPDLFNVSPWLLIAFFAAFSLLLFYILGKKGDPRKSEI
jgi:membrane protein implicated in regulation of membrane protease activity